MPSTPGLDPAKRGWICRGVARPHGVLGFAGRQSYCPKSQTCPILTVPVSGDSPYAGTPTGKIGGATYPFLSPYRSRSACATGSGALYQRSTHWLHGMSPAPATSGQLLGGYADIPLAFPQSRDLLYLGYRLNPYCRADQPGTPGPEWTAYHAGRLTVNRLDAYHKDAGGSKPGATSRYGITQQYNNFLTGQW